MTMKIYDRRGVLAPTMTVTHVRADIGRFWMLMARRGAIDIKQGNKTIAVALSLDQFVSILFGIQTQPHHKKSRTHGKTAKKVHKFR